MTKKSGRDYITKIYTLQYFPDFSGKNVRIKKSRSTDVERDFFVSIKFLIEETGEQTEGRFVFLFLFAVPGFML